MRILNLAAYRFTPFDGDLKPLRERLKARCRELQLRGTILLSREGINLFIAGSETNARTLLRELRSLPGLENLEAKESWSDRQPFRRMLVRIKREIIAFGVEGIDPARNPAPRISARELRQWLDEGRPVALLDTRNDYEVKLGTFRNAIAPPIRHFRDFPKAAKALPDTLKSMPVVTFCTGGIRCEKAAPLLQREGFREVYQLDGGILRYFEETGGAHFDGECFVFDQRVGVDASLSETGTTQCYACQSLLRPADLSYPQYVPGKSCPFCYRDPAAEQEALLAARNSAIREATDPLPGAGPYDNFRPVHVPERCDGAQLPDFLAECIRSLSREEWLEVIAGGGIHDATGPVGPDRIVRAGEQYRRRMPGIVEPPVNADIRILYEDDAIIVLHKPAPLPVHPCGRFNRNTLQHILETVYAPFKPRPVHRLDANTSGVLLAARTRHFAALLQPQFERREVAKRYLVRVIGHPPADAFTCNAPVTTGTGVAGSRGIAAGGEGADAITQFAVLRRDPDGTALLEAAPRTGRTNQIRLHCRHLGFPVAGDLLYGGNDGRETSPPPTLDPADPPLCLHSWQLTILHPLRREQMTFASPPPPWAQLAEIDPPGPAVI